MAKQKFTVVWGKIGDDSEKRLDRVEAEPTFEAVMDEAWKAAYADLPEGHDYGSFGEYRNHQPYDGYCILEGHPAEAGFSFTE